MFPRGHSQSVNALPPTPASKFKVPLNVEMLSALLPAWRAAWTIVNLSRQNREGPRKANPPRLGGYWGVYCTISLRLFRTTRESMLSQGVGYPQHVSVQVLRKCTCTPRELPVGRYIPRYSEREGDGAYSS